jgi:hypothetical protein
MKKVIRAIHGEQGSALIVTIMVLALLSIVAFSSVRSSTTEVQIAGNELQHQKYFYTAEAGIDHAVKLLEEHFRTANATAVRLGAKANWNFAFSGNDQKQNTSDDAVDRDGDDLGSYAEAAVWIDNARIDGISYRITLWNNDDSALGGTFNDDRDGMVWIRSDATGPKGGGASIQMLLQAGKNYTGNDLNPIVDFSRQL